MDSCKIVKDLNQKQFSTVLNDIQIFISSERKIDCSEICSILRALYQAVVPSSVEIESAKTTVFDMIPCINLCIDHIRSNFPWSDLVKNQFFPILYHIIRTFVKVELYHPALSCGNVLKSFLEDSENDFDDKMSYIKNMSVIFWNDALRIEKSENIIDFNMALILRTASIDFLFLDKTCIDNINEKIKVALLRYCHSKNNIDLEKLGDFLHRMWFHLLNFSINYKHKAYLYKILQTWYEILLKYLNDYSVMRHLLVWFQDLSKTCKKKEQKVLSTCSVLAKFCIQIFIFHESDAKLKKMCSNFEGFYKNSEERSKVDIEILANTCGIIYSSFAKFFRPLRNSDDDVLLTFLQCNMNSCLMLVYNFIDMLSEEAIQKNSTLPSYLKISTCHTLTNTFSVLIKKEQNETKKNQLIQEAEKFVKFSFSRVTVNTETEDGGKNIIAFASSITRLAMTLYGSNLYSESTYFFEVADSIFSMFCSLPEYNTEETQLTLWKLHEVFIYVCFLTGYHEKALQVVAKSLLVHEKKTKECFDLWRKVKRDAARNGKDNVLPKTVSDFLLNMNIEIDTEKEIMYLVEEFKICKTERCNLDNEIIALTEKILNMGCSESDRAYVLLEILTLPSNLSHKISENIKKSLSEISIEVINLYVNLLAKTPEDYSAKLYLSAAYFWLYHNSLKEIHDIAEKEAQNILKPVSPKPVAGVQNDVEEENDTCDIQPVHPLVSLSFESETFKNLNLAIQLWDDIPENQWKELSHIIKEKNLLDLIQATAEIFSSAVHDFKELKLWLLLRSISIATRSKCHELIAGVSLINLLIRLGYLNLASHFIEDVQTSAGDFNNNDYENIEIKFKMSKAYYFLHTGKFDDGLQILQAILSSHTLEKRFKSVKMLHAETLILLSDYLRLPTKAFFNSENTNYLVTNSSLAVLMESVSICKALLKHFSEKQGASANGFDWICFKPLLIKNLLRAHIHLGELYFKSGDPRLSRCFLQDALKLAESQILTYWSSKILIILGQIDFMCDNFKDCHVKANGLKYIMGQNVKANYSEVLSYLQAKYSTSNSEEPLSPDSPDGLIISTVPDIALPRQIKQTFIEKIDVMSSPMSKRHMKNNSDKLIQCNFDEEKFSMNLLQLESALLSYLLSQTEIDAKQSVGGLHNLSNYYNELKNSKNFYNVLLTVKLNKSVKEPYVRLQSKHEILLYLSIQLKKVESYCLKNDILNAKETVTKTFSFLEKASCYPNYLYPDVYAALKYHDIRITLCDYYQISLNSSLAYYFCQSVTPNMFLKKNVCSENSAFVNTPNTPVRKNMPNIVITEYQFKTKKCQAPLKKNLLNSNLKRDLDCEISIHNSPIVMFSSSDETENFESPFNSLSRASKTRSGQKKVSKKDVMADKNSGTQYRIFTRKNSALGVKNASDVWNLCLADTPKLGKENRKLRSSKTLPKPSQVSKKKTRSAASAHESTRSKTKSQKAVISNSFMPADSNANKLDEPLKENNSVTYDSSQKKMSIEYSRSSPHNKISDDTFQIHSSHNINPGFSADALSSDNVFFSPLKNSKQTEIPYLIDDLCKDLSSLKLTKSKLQHVAAGNLDEVINELNELRMLIQNIMPYPLYGEICKLLGILYLVKRDGTWHDENILESSFLLSEAFFISLRNVYFGNMTYYKESEFFREKEIISKILRIDNCDIDQQMKSFLQLIPEDWSVIQVSALHNQEYLTASDPLPCPTKLIISQFQKNSAPVIVSTGCSSDERFSSSFLIEFGKILEESYLTMLNNDSKSWWTTRSSLDLRMRNLTREMENIWLGCWKGLFLGIPQNEERVKQLQTTADTISQLIPCTNNRLLQILIDSAQRLSKEQVCAAVCYIWSCNHDDVIHKKLCKPIRDLSISLPDTDRHPVILILDQSIQDLPWECMPLLKNVPISRMPSLSILYSKLAILEAESVLYKGFDTSKTYYVLNPGGDLTHSQTYFQNRFMNQESWNGVIGRAPCVKDYISGLKEHEFFIYCGHGSGRKYLEGTSIDKLKLQSTSILMGCSSGKLRRLGRVLEAHGIVLRLLLSGCPSITANLWDVTDKDIDRFTEKLLQSLVPNYDDIQCKRYDVAKAVSFARSACKMSYLVGAAPVVYGFPVFAMNQ